MRSSHLGSGHLSYDLTVNSSVLVLREECKQVDFLGDDFRIPFSRSAFFLAPTADTVHASTRDSFTVDTKCLCGKRLHCCFKRSVVPTLFPEVELQNQDDRDVAKASRLNLLNDVTFVSCSSCLFPPTRPYRAYSMMVSLRLPVGSQGRCTSSYFGSTFLVLFHSCVEQVCFIVPVIRELMPLTRALWDLQFLLYSRLVFRSSFDEHDNEALWWCPSSTSPSTSGSLALLVLCRQTRPGAELSGTV